MQKSKRCRIFFSRIGKMSLYVWKERRWQIHNFQDGLGQSRGIGCANLLFGLFFGKLHENERNRTGADWRLLGPANERAVNVSCQRVKSDISSDMNY